MDWIAMNLITIRVKWAFESEFIDYSKKNYYKYYKKVKYL